MLKKLSESTNSILTGSKMCGTSSAVLFESFSDGGSTKGSNIFLGHVV